MIINPNELRMCWSKFSEVIETQSIGVAFVVETEASAMLCSYLRGDRFCFCYVQGENYTAFVGSSAYDSENSTTEEEIRGVAYSLAPSVWGVAL